MRKVPMRDYVNLGLLDGIRKLEEIDHQVIKSFEERVNLNLIKIINQKIHRSGNFNLLFPKKKNCTLFALFEYNPENALLQWWCMFSREDRLHALNNPIPVQDLNKF